MHHLEANLTSKSLWPRMYLRNSDISERTFESHQTVPIRPAGAAIQSPLWDVSEIAMMHTGTQGVLYNHVQQPEKLVESSQQNSP